MMMMLMMMMIMICTLSLQGQLHCCLGHCASGQGSCQWFRLWLIPGTFGSHLATGTMVGEPASLNHYILTAYPLYKT